MDTGIAAELWGVDLGGITLECQEFETDRRQGKFSQVRRLSERLQVVGPRVKRCV